MELSPEQLQRSILDDNIIELGDRVKIVTADGTRHEFKVTSVQDGHVVGEGISIPVIDIIALETRSFSGGKTSALVGGTFLWLYIILLAIPAIVVM